jgi:hypothetical protein
VTAQRRWCGTRVHTASMPMVGELIEPRFNACGHERWAGMSPQGMARWPCAWRGGPP